MNKWFLGDLNAQDLSDFSIYMLEQQALMMNVVSANAENGSALDIASAIEGGLIAYQQLTSYMTMLFVHRFGYDKKERELAELFLRENEEIAKASHEYLELSGIRKAMEESMDLIVASLDDEDDEDEHEVQDYLEIYDFTVLHEVLDKMKEE